jgi:hypothetical protein
MLKNRWVTSSDVTDLAAIWGLGSICWNRFGRNLREKANLVKFKSVIMAL